MISFEREDKTEFIEYTLVDDGQICASVKARPAGADLMLFDLIYQQGYDRFLFNSILIAMKNVPYSRILTHDGRLVEYGFCDIGGVYAIERDKIGCKCSCGDKNGEQEFY